MGKLAEQSAPYARAFAITPADGANLSANTRAIYVGGTGTLKVDTVGGDTVTFTGLPVGAILPIRAKKVYATGTSATLLIGLY